MEPTHNRRVILYIAMSLDGFIARPDGDLDFLSIVEQEGEDYGYAEFVADVDTVIMGRKTYEKVASMGHPDPHPGRDLYILSRTPQPSEGNIHYFNGEFKDLVRELKSRAGKHIFLDSGGETVHQFLQENLVDELVISIIPILLGEGIPLFRPGRPENRLVLVEAKPFAKGLVQLHYFRRGQA